MEKAILKTLIYGDIFRFPMKAWEIHKWLIGKKATLFQVEKALEKLIRHSSIVIRQSYYFLPGRSGIVKKRLVREKHSQRLLFQARLVAGLLKAVPFIKLVGVSGNLAMEMAGEIDDIDLFVVTQKKKMWISRILMLSLLNLVNKRRKRADSRKKASGKVCINLILEEDSLAQDKKDIYLAHEVLQMKLLWQRDGIYFKFLEENSWAFRFLPNWITSNVQLLVPYRVSNSSSDKLGPNRLTSRSSRLERFGHPRLIQAETHLRRNVVSLPVSLLENLARLVQLRYMGSPSGMERIEPGALYFHPQDYGPKVLAKYQKKLKIFDIS